MIKLEHVVLASPEQMEFIIEGMRNPMNSWNKTDSFNGCETYKVGTVANSCSTMHKIQAKEFTLDDFSYEHICIRQSMDMIKDTIDALNVFRDVYLNGGNLRYENGNVRCFGKKDKDIWWQMIQLLPSSYNQTRNVMMNYEVLANIYKSRKDHKLDEWRSFCKWIEDLPYSELIMEAVGSLEARRIFGETARANLCNMEDVEEAIKHFDPNDEVKTHMTMMKED